VDAVFHSFQKPFTQARPLSNQLNAFADLVFKVHLDPDQKIKPGLCQLDQQIDITSRRMGPVGI
jgi:hypothetical protein